MRYLGGKSKIRKELSKFLESVRLEGQAYFEPFCGGGWVLQEMRGERIASDGNKALIAMYQALQDGWIPPDYVSEDEYKQVKLASDINDPMYAFCGFGVSFAGKWWGGYARSSNKVCYAATSKVVSEYDAPEDFVCVREFISQMGLSVGDKETRPKRVERVFMHKDQTYLANM